MESHPVIPMVGGNEVLGRFMALRAFVADQSLAVAIHARGHVREMTGECGLVLGVKILVTDLALNRGGADMSLMTELGTISRYPRAQGGRVAEMANSTFTRFVHAVTVRALCMSGKQIVTAGTAFRGGGMAGIAGESGICFVKRMVELELSGFRRSHALPLSTEGIGDLN
jgi:hypothetical protein